MDGIGDIMLSEISQTEKDIYHMFCLICAISYVECQTGSVWSGCQLEQEAVCVLGGGSGGKYG
jgi:hypothetical protein